MVYFHRSIPLVAMLCVSLLFSCITDPDEPPSYELNSSSIILSSSSLCRGEHYGSEVELNEITCDFPEVYSDSPSILEAKTIVNLNGTIETMIWVNTKLDYASLNKFICSDQFPIIIKQSNPFKKDSVSGYKLSSISFSGADCPNGYVYTITGEVCMSRYECGGRGNLIVNSGDSLSFNVNYDDLLEAGFKNTKDIALPSNDWYVKSAIGVEATGVSWADNRTKLPPISFEPIYDESKPHY